MVASTPDEVEPLKDLQARGEANGLRDLRLLGIEEMREIEPHVAGVAALHVKEEGIVDYSKMCVELIREIERLGGEVHFDSGVKKIRRVPEGWVIECSSREITADYLINCAGLYSDRVAKMAGENPTSKSSPFAVNILK